MKEDQLERARSIFKDLGVRITTEGRPLLGSPVGCEAFSSSFLTNQVSKWVAEVKTLSLFAKTQPHAAYSAFTHGLSSKWLYLARSCGMLSTCIGPIEDAMRTSFLPALTGRMLSDLERRLLALPCRLGGLGLINPLDSVPQAYTNAADTTKPLVDHILKATPDSAADVFAKQQIASSASKRSHNLLLRAQQAALVDELPHRLQRALDTASEKGASNWLTALPLEEHDFVLSKSDFRDALHIRYGWYPAFLPSTCTCGKSFTVDHALSCPHGGYLGLRHNEVRDLLANLLQETCHNVMVEPHLNPLEGEQFPRSANTSADARLDFCGNGFWGGSKYSCAYFDVRVFHPHAQSYLNTALEKCYRDQEQGKRRQYERRVREVERASFTPLVFASTGGSAPAATVFLKRLASLLSAKREIPYGITISWLRVRLSFALLRSSILCIRGSRKPRSAPLIAHAPLPEVAVAESRVEHAADH